MPVTTRGGFNGDMMTAARVSGVFSKEKVNVLLRLEELKVFSYMSSMPTTWSCCTVSWRQRDMRKSRSRTWQRIPQEWSNLRTFSDLLRPSHSYRYFVAILIIIITTIALISLIITRVSILVAVISQQPVLTPAPEQWQDTLCRQQIWRSPFTFRRIPQLQAVNANETLADIDLVSQVEQLVLPGGHPESSRFYPCTRLCYPTNLPHSRCFKRVPCGLLNLRAGGGGRKVV